MKICNAELEYDFLDADSVENFEQNIDKMVKITDRLKVSGIKSSEVIRDICNAVIELIDGLFGEGTSKKVFGDKCNLSDALTAVDDLMTAKTEQEQALANKFSKYTLNREQRRGNKK